MKIATIIIGSVIVIIFVVLTFLLNKNVRTGVVTIGSRITKTPFQLKNTKFSLFSGNGELKGLLISNPNGFNEDNAIIMDKVNFNIDTTSLFSNNIVINYVKIDGINVMYEVLENSSNIATILKNIESLGEGDDKQNNITTESYIGTNKKAYIKNIIFRNGNVKVSNKTLQEAKTLTLPTIEHAEIGNEPQDLKNTKNKARDRKKSDKMRAVDFQEIAKILFKALEKAILTTVEKSEMIKKEREESVYLAPVHALTIPVKCILHTGLKNMAFEVEFKKASPIKQLSKSNLRDGADVKPIHTFLLSS